MLLTSKKRVTFYHTSFVVLIPTAYEYYEAGLKDILWWNRNDINNFKNNFKKIEIKKY